ncbi:hypothetical protein [Luteolibacter luteus]|uniref:Molecular chaperone n=1 Tax=Luteolibacter luteus TaxID=2728835 RepID=A0A858RKP1_9BACT|nr:hypothetical protein [Luteolibacter luteus]QJE97028.1 hypothetical protein HHL09_14950 [Luteolibacter luteus]
MTGIRSLFHLVWLCVLAVPAMAQVDVRLQMARNTFVAGEPVEVVVSITNQSGQDLTLQGDSRQGWINFTVMGANRDGVPLSALSQPAFGAAKIPFGQTMSRRFDLAQMYPLREMGNFSVYAVVRLPGQTRDGFISNRLLFNISTARPYWTQKVGLPGKPGQMREFRVLNFNNGRKTYLYGQVMNTKTGSALQTHSLGEYLSFSKPAVALDNRQTMHVLYLIAPTVWSHARIGPDGSLLGSQLHKAAGSINPQLFTMKDGSVQVGNSIPYDPKAEAEARGKVRKASERPSF